MKKDIILWPLVKYEDNWSIPDELLLIIWKQIVLKGKDKETFYDGSVKNEEEWLNYIKNPNIFVIVAVSKSYADTLIKEPLQIVGIGWLTNIYDGVGEAHFCFLGYPSIKVGKMVLQYWTKTLPLNVIIGYTPKSYETVIKLLKRWGFKQLVGEIPNYCNMIYKNIREGAIVSYYQIKGETYE